MMSLSRRKNVNEAPLKERMAQTYDPEGTSAKRAAKISAQLTGKKSAYASAVESVLFWAMMLVTFVTNQAVAGALLVFKLNQKYGPIIVKKISSSIRGKPKDAGKAKRRKSSLLGKKKE